MVLWALERLRFNHPALSRYRASVLSPLFSLSQSQSSAVLHSSYFELSEGILLLIYPLLIKISSDSHLGTELFHVDLLQFVLSRIVLLLRISFDIKLTSSMFFFQSYL